MDTITVDSEMCWVGLLAHLLEGGSLGRGEGQEEYILKRMLLGCTMTVLFDKALS